MEIGDLFVVGPSKSGNRDFVGYIWRATEISTNGTLLLATNMNVSHKNPNYCAILRIAEFDFVVLTREVIESIAMSTEVVHSRSAESLEDLLKDIDVNL